VAWLSSDAFNRLPGNLPTSTIEYSHRALDGPLGSVMRMHREMADTRPESCYRVDDHRVDELLVLRRRTGEAQILWKKARTG